MGSEFHPQPRAAEPPQAAASSGGQMSAACPSRLGQTASGPASQRAFSPTRSGPSRAEDCPFRAGAASSGAAAAEPNSGLSCDDAVGLKFGDGDVNRIQACKSLRVDWSLFTAEGLFLDQQNDKTSQQGERQLANGVIGHVDKMRRESTD